MSSCTAGNDFEDHLLKALRVRYIVFLHLVVVLSYMSLHALGCCLFQLDSVTSEDPAYVQPCITVLKKLNSHFYRGLKNEVKVPGHLFPSRIMSLLFIITRSV